TLALLDEIVPHRVERRGGALRHADLLVDVLDVVAHGRRRDAERRRHLLVGESLGEVDHDLDLAVGEPAGALFRPWSLPRRGEDALDRMRAETTLRGAVAE